jgi:uncharacterized protein involved in exopolysaccharide biosynthesis
VDSLRILVQQYLRAAWRRRWMGVAVAWLICGVGWVGVYMIPNQFESSARLFVDADAILTPLLRGLAADTAPATQLEILQRTLLSRPNMEKLISKTDLAWCRRPGTCAPSPIVTRARKWRTTWCKPC